MVNREGDGINFLQRAALYGLLGLMSGRRGDDLARLAIGMPILEKLTGVTLEEALAAEAQRQQEIEQQQRLEQIRAAILTTLKSTSAEPVASSLNTDLLVPDGITATIEPDARWRQVVIHPSVILVLGKRGSGKSALGYRILELLRYTLTPYVVGVPGATRSLLPDWAGIAPSLEDVPPKSIALVDEAYLRY